jgi:pentatricopeptide repeat protein
MLESEKLATNAVEPAPSPDMDESSADDDESTTPANSLPFAAPSAELSPPALSTEPLAFSYAAAIRAHEAAGDWQAALELFDRLEARDVRADAHCYCAALGACRRGGLADRAVEILSGVRSKGEVEPNSVMYTLAMAACSAGKQWETSLRLFDEHKEVVGVKGEPYCFSVAMGACAQGRQWERALSLLEEMEGDADCAGNAFAWNRAMVTCNRAAQPNKTLELYERIRSGACELSDHSVAAALDACKNLTDKEASWQRAQAIFDGHKEIAAVSPMCQGALLDTLAEAYQWELVLSYFDTWRSTKKPNPKCYERAIEACDRSDPDRSMTLFTEMRRLYASSAAAK